jgi:hypothetical protein
MSGLPGQSLAVSVKYAERDKVLIPYQCRGSRDKRKSRQNMTQAKVIIVLIPYQCRGSRDKVIRKNPTKKHLKGVLIPYQCRGSRDPFRDTFCRILRNRFVLIPYQCRGSRDKHEKAETLIAELMRLNPLSMSGLPGLTKNYLISVRNNES